MANLVCYLPDSNNGSRGRVCSLKYVLEQICYCLSCSDNFHIHVTPVLEKQVSVVGYDPLVRCETIGFCRCSPLNTIPPSVLCTRIVVAEV
eukprot:1968920-Prymnesium_polylepis.1